MSIKPTNDNGYIIVDGKQIEVFNVQMDYEPLPPAPDATKQFNEAMRRARQKVVVDFGISAPHVGVQHDGQIVPTGPVVEGSVEKEEQANAE